MWSWLNCIKLTPLAFILGLNSSANAAGPAIYLFERGNLTASHQYVASETSNPVLSVCFLAQSEEPISEDCQKIWADSLLNLGNELINISQFQEALQLSQNALEIYRKIDDLQGETKALINLGLAHFNLGDYQTSVDLYQQSLLFAREVGDRQSEANSITNLGNTHLAQGNYSQAIAFYEESIPIYLEIGDRLGEAKTLGNLGLAYFSLGQFQRAINYHERALEIAEEIESRYWEAGTLGNLGLAYFQLGDYQQAIGFHEQSLAMAREIGNQQGESIALGNLGLAYFQLGNYQQAIDFHEQSLVSAREIGDLRGEANALGNLGVAYYRLDDSQQAIDFHRQSLAIALEIGDRQGESNALGNLGIVYDKLGDYQQAITFHQKSLTLKREIEDRHGEAGALANLGYSFESLNKKELAIVFFKEAINTYENIRQSNRELESYLQDSYTSTIESNYRRLAELLLDQDRILEAQRVLDLLKVQELDDYLRGVRSSENSRAGAELVPPEQVVARSYDDLTDQAIENGKRLRQLEDQETLTNDERDEMVALQAERQEILQAFNRFKDSELVQAQLALLSREELSRNVQLDELAALRDNLGQIPQGAVMLYPLILDDQLELIVTSPYTPPIHRTVNVTADELRDQVTAFRYALAEPTRDAQAPAQQLYEWLIAPIEAELEAAGVKTIIYAPDRTLRYIPLAALYDAERDQWLTERYRINHITSASLTDLNTPPQNDPTILAGALTEGPLTVNAGGIDLTMSLLQYADDEVNGIALLDDNVLALLDTDFNPALIQREANRYTILHLATHAKFLIDAPEASFILFSGGQRWTLADLDEGLLSLDRVDLVVLSACETGIDNTFGNGAEILSFGHLMQEAGARASMSSLWAVDDGGTQILMYAFYEGLIDGNLSKVAALQQAQLALIRLAEEGDRGGFELAQSVGLDPNDLAHPHYWAPFILIGNGL
jgi:CHAT domain-containing protein